MHIPDNYLSVSTCVAMTLAIVPVWRHSIKVTMRDFPRERFSALGAAAAFSFLAMMFNIPLPGGTTGHAVGGAALALLWGPEAACIAITIALAVQALLFGDGGILAFGANAFNIAFVLPFSGYYAFLLLKRVFKTLRLTGRSWNNIGIALASFLGINLAALATAVELGIQPYLFCDANGQALYCPYPLSVAIPAMAIGHLTLFGLAEVVFSVAVCAFIVKVAPESISGSPILETADKKKTSEVAPPKKDAFGAVYLALALMTLWVPIGLCAQGTAWGEWGVDDIQDVVVNNASLGYVPQGMQTGFQWTAPFADYSASGLPDWLAYILAAAAGTAASIILFKLASVLKRERERFDC